MTGKICLEKTDGGKIGTVVVIGTGRFGNGLAQGMRQASIRTSQTSIIQARVIHLSAKRFMSGTVSDMAAQLRNASFVAFCGYDLPGHSVKLAEAMREARVHSDPCGDCLLEFMDFSNPCPVTEKSDVEGAMKLWKQLHVENNHNWKCWKIAECGSLDVSGNEEPHHDYALVYGEGVMSGEVPKIKIPGLRWLCQSTEHFSLLDEAYDRIMQRAEVDRWYDAVAMGLAVFVVTFAYAVCRYSETFNGKYPWSMVPMYILDKSVAWTGLWMMVVSPFAGNLLALSLMWQRLGKCSCIDKAVFIAGVVLMAWPTLEFILPCLVWYFMRNVVFAKRSSSLYLMQDSSNCPEVTSREKNTLKAMLVDMVSLKGETGCVGFFYAFWHSFMGFIIADAAYKKWFDKETGRLYWEDEVCLMTGCASTALLFFVALRSLFGKASWIRLKPVYAYASPIGMWLATVHVVAFGVAGWYKLFDGEYHNGQMSITFMSSIFPFGVLTLNHIMQIAGSKKRLGQVDLWKHSVTMMSKTEWKLLEQQWTGEGKSEAHATQVANI